jgi:hypothetical protein
MAKNTVIILFRHAEKPDNGPDLSPAGFKHAEAYVPFISQYHVGAHPLQVSALFAAADSKASFRPRLTLAPLSKALQLPINTDYEDRQTAPLAARLLSDEFNGKSVVICWKHGQILALADALVGDSAELKKKAHWPDNWPEDQYDWILQIVFDGAGALDVHNTYCIKHPALN